MNTFGFLAATVRHYWRTTLAILLGCAVGASALTGALLVGDSMRGSLRQVTLQRLGDIDLTLVGTRFFAGDLDGRLRAAEGYGDSFDAAAAVVLVQGAVRLQRPQDEGGDLVVPQVQVVGTTPQFWELFPGAGDRAERILVSRALADELDLTGAGARLLVQFEQASSIPREGLMGGRRGAETLESLSVQVDGALADAEGGRFTLDTTQALPRTVFVPRELLADRLDQAGRANALLLSATNDRARAQPQVAQELLARAVAADDLGLQVRTSEGLNYVSVESRRKVIEPALEAGIERAAAKLGTAAAPALTYLATALRIGEREVPYSVIAAVESAADGPNDLRTATGEPAEIAGDGIWLNAWTADRLKPQPGDMVTVEYLAVQADGSLASASHDFTYAGTVPLAGVAADAMFTPEYPGITDAAGIAQWDAPFDIDLARITPEDEAYWERYRGAPKAFVALPIGRELFGTRFGELTSLRLPVPGGQGVAAFADRVRLAVRDETAPASLGMTFFATKANDLSASSGSTDFGGLFLAFSFFLIVAAALLVGLLFRLSVEQRASQLGLLAAVGFTPGRIRRLLLTEGLAIAALGSLLGLLGGTAYCRAMLYGLTTAWRDAVGTPFIDYHQTALSFAIGWVASVAVALVAVWWAARAVGKTSPVTLLKSGFHTAAAGGGGRWLTASTAAGLLGGVVLIGLGAAAALPSVAAFFGGAFLLLVGCLAWFAKLLGNQGSAITAARGLAGRTLLGIRNGGRFRGRSVLTVTLLALATFVVVAVGTLRHGAGSQPVAKDTGNGGFAVVAETTLPLYQSLDDPDVRYDELLLTDDTEQIFTSQDVRTTAFRVRPGDDTSCLNVYQPRDPTLLAASPEFVRRGGFVFASSLAETAAERDNPWLLLDKDFGEGVIPAIGDANTLQWILKVPVGERLPVVVEDGTEKQILVVGALSQSVFQGELVVGAERFAAAFPSRSGFRYFLMELDDPTPAAELATRLNTELSDYGMAAETTRRRIAQYLAVQNTYMATFQTLGGLGLLLGTFGLATVLLRNVLERHRELALMRAVGFTRGQLGWFVLVENLMLLLAGVGIGTACAAVAVIPQLLALPAAGELSSLGWLLLAVLAAGLVTGTLAIVAALRTPILAGLRAD